MRLLCKLAWCLPWLWAKWAPRINYFQPKLFAPRLHSSSVPAVWRWSFVGTDGIQQGGERLFWENGRLCHSTSSAKRVEAANFHPGKRIRPQSETTERHPQVACPLSRRGTPFLTLSHYTITPPILYRSKATHTKHCLVYWSVHHHHRPWNWQNTGQSSTWTTWQTTCTEWNKSLTTLNASSTTLVSESFTTKISLWIQRFFLFLPNCLTNLLLF